MAEHCKQCSERLGFPDNDFEGIVSAYLKYFQMNEELEDLNTLTVTVLCEGCGFTEVNEQGECVGRCEGLPVQYGGTGVPCILPSENAK